MDTVILSTKLVEDIMSIVDEVKDQTQLELYMGSACTNDRKLLWQAMHNLTSKGNFGTITIVPSKSFHVEASVIQPFFIKAPTSSPVATSQPQTIVLHPADHDSKEVEALQGHAKSNLFFIGGVVDFGNATVENVTYAIDST